MEIFSTEILLIIGGIVTSALFAFLGAKWGSQLALRNGNNNHNHAGLDKRLEIHQRAFSLSLQIPTAADDPEKNAKILHECNKFWKNNCLFMVPEVRDAFKIAYRTAWIFPTYKRQYEEGKIDEAEFNEIWNKITGSTQKIIKSIGLSWPHAIEPLHKASNYQRRASDWQKKDLDRRQDKQKKNILFMTRQN